jgi:hypothetical protein
MTDPTNPTDVLKAIPVEPVKLTFEEWEARFRPIKNYITENSPYDGFMFETYGNDFAIAVDSARTLKPAHVWTLFDSGIIGDGYHYIDRAGYFITEVPADGHCYEIGEPYETDEEDSVKEEHSELIERLENFELIPEDEDDASSPVERQQPADQGTR